MTLENRFPKHFPHVCQLLLYTINLFPLAFILIPLSSIHFSVILEVCHCVHTHVHWKNVYAQIHLLKKDGTTPKYFQKYFKLLFVLFVF